MLQFYLFIYLNIYIYLFVCWERNCAFPIQRREKNVEKIFQIIPNIINKQHFIRVSDHFLFTWGEGGEV